MTPEDIVFQLNTLNEDGYHAAEKIMRALLEMPEEQRTWLDVCITAIETQDADKVRHIWTHWCIIHDVENGTEKYTEKLNDLLSRSKNRPDSWWMGKYVRLYYLIQPRQATSSD